MRARLLTVAAAVGGALLVAVPEAGATTTGTDALGTISFGNLTCTYGINNNSEGYGICTGKGTTTQWTLHVGCNLNPVVKTLHETGPATATIGCWAVPGVNDAWITPGWS